MSIEELARIRTTDYIDLTRRPRKVPDQCRRVENEKVRDLLVKEVQIASDSSLLAGNYSTGNYDSSRIEHYESKVANGAVTLDRLKIHLRSCCWYFRDCGETFDHGLQSHYMEINCIAEMIDCNAPIDVMVEFFEGTEGFSEQYTRNKIKEIIAYGYSPFSREKLEENAAFFCSS